MTRPLIVAFGDWNWYLPRWLEWLPRLSVEGGRPDVPESMPLPATD